MSNNRTLLQRVQSHEWQSKSWMWDIRDMIQDINISQVAMCGTHDSATYNITKSSKFGSDSSDSLNENGAIGALANVFAGSVIAAWSKCQGMTVAQQLDYGVRYFDLRITAYPAGSTTLYSTHTMISTKLTDILSAVKAFVANPATANEFILLDFQHVFLSSSDAGYAEFFRQLTDMKDICISRPSSGTQFPKLKELWKCRPRVIIFMGCDFDSANLNFICQRDDYLSSPWMNKSTKRDLLQALGTNPIGAATPDANGVYVTQAVITPDGDTVAAGMFSFGIKPNSIRALAKSSNADLIAWFWENNTANTSYSGKNKNVLMLDFPDVCDTTVKWSGGSMTGSVVDICVCINIFRGMASST